MNSSWAMSTQLDVPIYYGVPFPTVYHHHEETRARHIRESRNSSSERRSFRHQNLLAQKSFEITDNFSYYLPSHAHDRGKG